MVQVDIVQPHFCIKKYFGGCGQRASPPPPPQQQQQQHLPSFSFEIIDDNESSRRDVTSSSLYRYSRHLRHCAVSSAARGFFHFSVFSTDSLSVSFASVFFLQSHHLRIFPVRCIY
jgi:hypothetical protein